MNFVFTNNASTTLAADIDSVATVIELAAGTGDRFPDPTMYTEQFALTLKNQQTDEVEIVYCTERNGDTLNVVRAQEGTVALSFSAGDVAAHQITAGVLEFLRDL